VASWGLGRGWRKVSAMLWRVRSSVFSIPSILVLAAALLALALQSAHSFQEGEPQSAQPQTPQPQQVAPSPAPAPTLAPAPLPRGPVIVLDPAHGGTDTGARGEGGRAEKDIVLQLARTVREQLTRQGYRVLMTRNEDLNPSYDDRAAVANAHPDVIFISVHVASTGTPGTARAYYDQLSSAVAQQTGATTTAIKPLAPQPKRTLVIWDQAQRPYLDASRRLADLIQVQLAQSFSGSPVTSTAAAVRTLRSVMGPAVAIEISSISGSTPEVLAGEGAPLSVAISRGISAVRPSGAEAR
jgi:N-acetylmuramoyl-L-alanine amidase